MNFTKTTGNSKNLTPGLFFVEYCIASCDACCLHSHSQGLVFYFRVCMFCDGVCVYVPPPRQCLWRPDRMSHPRAVELQAVANHHVGSGKSDISLAPEMLIIFALY